MGYQNNYPRPIVPNTPDNNIPVDFRAFYPYTPNEVKHRRRTTSAQLKVLEAVFKKDTKPNGSLRNELALQLDMTARGVQVWFQNRRAKEKSKSGKSPVPSSPVDGLKEEDYTFIKDESALDAILHPRSSDSAEDLDALSESPQSSGGTSPPQLHLITDTAHFPWQNPSVEPALHSASFPIRNTFASDPLYQQRRGSLPLNAFSPSQESLDSPVMDPFDPFIRRCSVDASLQRLATNPYANLARAKNSALYGPGFGVLPGTATRPPRDHQHQLNRLNYSYHIPSHLQRRVSSSFAHSVNMRRSSMDSRPVRFTAGMQHHSPSPSPLIPYNAVIRASLPDQRLYSVSTRAVASPIPGPLPSPGFSFGAASTPSMTSPSSGDSERNSPDSMRSFTFRGDEQDDESTSYDAYSRFGSIASIATSESSANGYYAEIGGSSIDPHVPEDRRDSCASGNFLGMLSNLEVGNENSVGSLPTFSHSDEYSFGRSNDGVKQPNDPYSSPTTTISARDDRGAHAQDTNPGVTVPISVSSELAFALETKPDQPTPQEQYMTYGGSEHQTAEQDSSSYYASQQQQQHQPQEHTEQQSLNMAYHPGVYPEGDYSAETQQQLDYAVMFDHATPYEPLSNGVSVSALDNALHGVDAFAYDT